MTLNPYTNGTLGEMTGQHAKSAPSHVGKLALSSRFNFKISMFPCVLPITYIPLGDSSGVSSDRCILAYCRVSTAHVL